MPGGKVRKEMTIALLGFQPAPPALNQKSIGAAVYDRLPTPLAAGCWKAGSRCFGQGPITEEVRFGGHDEDGGLVDTRSRVQDTRNV